MGARKNRVEDATFEINLAPLLDIIVSVIPMLLLSIVFLRITMIEAPLPQPVAEAIQNQKKDPTTTMDLHMSKKGGFRFAINENGKKSDILVPLKGNELDFH